MFHWCEQSIQWFERAAEATSYFENLAGQVAELVDKKDRVYDMGCGLGYLSQAMAKSFRQVVAIDQSALAIQHVRSLAIPNVNVYCGDGFSYSVAETVDAKVYCSFGRAQELIAEILQQQVGHYIIIKPNRLSGSLAQLKKDLQELEMDYTETMTEQEFGQPFVSLAEADCFYDYYKINRIMTKRQFRQKLQYDPDNLFPYYYPKLKQMSILGIEGKNYYI